jgi:CRP-like cAMP-binding protein
MAMCVPNISTSSRGTAVATWPATGNHLLRVLPENQLARHGRALTQVTLTHGQKLFVSCEPLSHVYFPITCVASRLHAAQCGHFAEMGMVGFEGVVGLSVFLGAKAAANNAVVHVEGIALRMEAAAAKAMFQQHPPFRAALLRYMRAMISQISLLAVCNSLHPIEQRLCRWLLLTDERASTDDLRITRDFIAQMLSAEPLYFQLNPIDEHLTWSAQRSACLPRTFQHLPCQAGSAPMANSTSANDAASLIAF